MLPVRLYTKPAFICDAPQAPRAVREQCTLMWLSEVDAGRVSLRMCVCWLLGCLCRLGSGSLYFWVVETMHSATAVHCGTSCYCVRWQPLMVELHGCFQQCESHT